MGALVSRGILVRALLLAGVFAAVALTPRAFGDSAILDYNGQGKLGAVRDVPAPAGEQGAPGPGTGGGEDRNGAAPQMQFPSADGAWSDPRTWYEPGEVVVGNPPPDFDMAVQAFGFRVVEKTHLDSLGLDVWRLKVPDGVSVPEAIRRLAQRFPGLLIDANHRYQGSAGPAAADSRPGSEPRALMGWNANDARCGEGIRIGMVDTPVDTDHEALRGQKIVTRSFIRSDRRPAPAYHGTAIATMLVGRPGDRGWGGLLPRAQLYAANIFALTDTGQQVADLVGMLKAVNWLAGQDVHVINMSIAGADNLLMRFAIAEAALRSVVLVAAVGNWGRTDPPAYPAAYGLVIGVTAIDAGKNVYDYANRGSYVAFAAPGVNIWTAIPGGGLYQSGTSFAVPYLTSIVATEIASGSSISASSLKRILSRQAVDLGAPGKDDVFGWGLIKRAPRCGGSAARAP